MPVPEDSAKPENQPPQPETPVAERRVVPQIVSENEPSLVTDLFASAPEPAHGLRWIFLGSQGLRSGWSVLIFSLLFGFFASGFAIAFLKLHWISKNATFNAYSAIIGELADLLPLLAAAALVALLERRNLLVFYLTGPRRAINFLSGYAAGFLALSALVGGLAWGGWLRFGAVALSGAALYKFAGLWTIAFLLVACFEEGAFRCYLQFTLTRGINFWWALGITGVVSALMLFSPSGNAVWGVYAAALLGLLPCLILEIRKSPRSGFWQASWVTSTIFGAIHTTNGGENWIGIFAASLIGFVFCVSVYVTGSAWWAIGCHAAWDWAETFFYGTADSGMVAPGHYLTTTPIGNPFWSGGTDGPEGSVLVLGVILLLLAVLMVIYGRRNPSLVLQVEAAGESKSVLG
jgi:hypothetical protein